MPCLHLFMLGLLRVRMKCDPFKVRVCTKFLPHQVVSLVVTKKTVELGAAKGTRFPGLGQLVDWIRGARREYIKKESNRQK